MRKLQLQYSLILFLIQSVTFGQPLILFEKTSIQADTIDFNSNGVFVFKFKNIGNEPLIISNIGTHSGCFIPVYFPKEPIAAKDSNIIKCYYDTKRVGGFEKTVDVISNSKAGTVVLHVKGYVLPFSEVLFLTSYKDFGLIQAGQILKFETEIRNNYAVPISIIDVKGKDENFAIEYIKAPIAKYSSSKVNITIDTKNLLGRLRKKLFFITDNGKTIAELNIDLHVFSSPLLFEKNELTVYRKQNDTCASKFEFEFLNNSNDTVEITNLREYVFDGLNHWDEPINHTYSEKPLEPKGKSKIQIVFYYNRDKVCDNKHEKIIIVETSIKNKGGHETYYLTCNIENEK